MTQFFGEGPLLVAAPLLIAAIVMAVRFVGCTQDFDQFLPHGDDGDGGGDNPRAKIVAGLSGSGELSVVATLPGHDPQTDQFTTNGVYHYEIPWWCTFIDLFLLGAGGGGTGALSAGNGGQGGSWTTLTLWRGTGGPPPGSVSIPVDTASITITVGAGGSPGTGNAGPESGGDTTVTAAGMPPQKALGGAGGANPDATGTGPNPPSVTVNGTTETGGADQTVPDAPGNAPGGGGSGGFLNGGPGADGAVWAIARQA